MPAESVSQAARRRREPTAARPTRDAGAGAGTPSPQRWTLGPGRCRRARRKRGPEREITARRATATLLTPSRPERPQQGHLRHPAAAAAALPGDLPSSATPLRLMREHAADGDRSSCDDGVARRTTAKVARDRRTASCRRRGRCIQRARGHLNLAGAPAVAIIHQPPAASSAGEREARTEHAGASQSDGADHAGAT